MPDTKGVEMLRRLNDGKIEVQLSSDASETRRQVTEALEELIEVGARVRPLFVNGKRSGGCAAYISRSESAEAMEYQRIVAALIRTNFLKGNRRIIVLRQ